MSVHELAGKRLERLIATLEKTLAGTMATIESPSRRLRDRDTGKPREHDILITWDHGHHQIITAIECRDRSRPVGVPDIEAFADKCASTGVNAGVIVSATGFRTTARTKATARSITCMDIEEVERFDWLGPAAMCIGYERQFGDMSVKIMFKGAQPEAIGTIFDTAGTELNNDQIMQTIANAVPQSDDPESEVGKIITLHIYVQTVDWTMRDDKGRIWHIDHILVDTTITMKKTVNPFQMHRYFGANKDYAVATADAQIGKRTSKFVLVRNQDDTTSCYLTFDDAVKSS